MCGFAGFMAFGPSPMGVVERHKTLVAMGHAIAHRGPDDAQYYDDGVLALVYRRLSIIDLEGGQQPFFNEQGDQLLVANGEVYNHGALRSALVAHHRFRSRSDCEVLLHGFEQWGQGVLDRTQGMFALAHWNLRDRTLTLARDRLGIKPLYLCRLPGGVLFGSELKALLAHPECPRSISWRDVDRQLIVQPTTATYVEGVEFLPGGHCMVLDAGGQVRTHRYWDLRDHLGAAPFGDDPQRYMRRYAEQLEEVTLQHMQRDVGAGILLSGGVDSSLIAGIVATRDRNVPCLTVVERSSYLGGDAEAARKLTSGLGLPWLPVRFDYRTLIQDLQFDLRRFEESVLMMDSPRFELEWIFKSELHHVARHHCPGLKVALLGQGADEFAGGYSHRIDAPRSAWQDYLRAEVDPNLVFDDATQGRSSATLWSYARYRPDEVDAAPYHRFMLMLVRQLQHHNLWHEDRTSAWHSIEARVPFLDHTLVELLASVPASLHQDLFWNKTIVRAALDRFVPGHPIQQPKIGFIGGKDTSSQELILHRLLQNIAPAFREEYLGRNDGPFDTARLDALLNQALGRGPRAGAALNDALNCLAIAVFERQLREASARPAPSEQRVVLPLMQPQDWNDWSVAMRAPPICGRTWQLSDVVTLAEGVDVFQPLRGDGRRICFLRGGVFAGDITLANADNWLSVLLKNLGLGAARSFSVQDWLDEFEITHAEFAAAMDVLHHQGVVDTAAVPVAIGKLSTSVTGPAPTPGAVAGAPAG